MVTAAQTDTGEKLVVALPLATNGVTIGNHFDLLALGSTASSFLKLDDVYVGDDQILSRDIESFLTGSARRFWCCNRQCVLGWPAGVLMRSNPALPA